MLLKLKSKIGLSVFALVLCFFSLPSFAEKSDTYDFHLYLSGGFTLWQVPNAGFSGGLTINFGTQIFTYGGLENHIIVGFPDPNTNNWMTFLFGTYARANLPLGWVNPYAKVGFTYSNLKLAEQVTNDFDLGWGLGTEINFPKNIFMDFSYMSYLSLGELTMDAFNLTIGYKFR